MTPEKAFKMGGTHPITGISTREWYALGSTFFPNPVLHEGELLIGTRSVSAMDVASGYMMDFDMQPEQPGTLRAPRLLSLMQRLEEKYGAPSIGWIISHSCWLSSLELLLDDDTSEQGRFLKEAGIEFGPMLDGDKGLLTAWAIDRDIKLLFDADQIPPKR